MGDSCFVRGARARSHNRNFDVRQSRRLPQFLQYFDAIAFGQAKVKNDYAGFMTRKRRPMVPHIFKRLAAVFEYLQLVGFARSIKGIAEQRDIAGIIFNQ